MGRGRQKAKHTKVARDLKYYSPPTDLTALQRELQSQRSDCRLPTERTWPRTTTIELTRTHRPSIAAEDAPVHPEYRGLAP